MVNNAFSMLYNMYESERGRRFAASQAQQQRDYLTRMWYLNNEYNSPYEQMKRLKEAGLNPSLMYGQPVSEAQQPSGAAEASSGLLGAPHLTNPAAGLETVFADIELKRAQAAEIRSRIPVNEKKPEVMQASIDALASQAKLNVEKINTEQSVQALNKLVGKKVAEETRKVCTEVGQLIESFPLKLQELNASIYELKTRGDVNSENARFIKQQADTFMQDIQLKWKSLNAQIELMKAQELDAYSSALLKSYQSEYNKSLKEFQDIVNGVKDDTAKAEAVTGIISRMLGAASGVISAIGSLRSGTPNLNAQPVGGSPAYVPGWDG